jgi:thiamine-monophosphate kinase
VLSFASAAMDVSDGLVGDLAKLCRASSLAADVDVAQVPFSDAVHTAIASRPTLLETVLTGGDDYEIVLTVAPAKLQAFQAAARTALVPVTEIGRMRAGDGANFTREGKPLVFTRPAFSHF